MNVIPIDDLVDAVCVVTNLILPGIPTQIPTGHAFNLNYFVYYFPVFTLTKNEFSN